MDRFCLADQFPVQPRQPREVPLRGQQLRLESLQPGCQCCATLPDLLRTDQPEGRILGEPFRIVHIFVTSQAAVDRLAQKVRHRELSILSLPQIGQMLSNEFTESQPFVQLPNQNQAAVGGDPRSLEIDLQRTIERELKWLILSLTHRVWPSRASLSRSNLHKHR